MCNYVKLILSARLMLAAMIVATALTTSSCKDSDDDYTIQFSTPALYFQTLGSTQSAGVYCNRDYSRLEVTSVPDGWKAELSADHKRLTVTAPKTLDAYTDGGKTVTPAANGSVIVHGTGVGESYSATLHVTISAVVDLSASQANSYVITQASAGYEISAVPPGQYSAATGAESVETVWSTTVNLIKYLALDESGKRISFMTNSNKDGSLMEGNALIALCDKNGNRLWCWHLWVTANDPTQNTAQLNGHTFMSSNLGAFGNSAGDDDAILASYGLYYQWGRPTPFPRPRYYNCADAADQLMYNNAGKNITMKVDKADDYNTTMTAALDEPLTFVTGLTKPWYTGESTAPWTDSKKSIYDPCPAGWRVPPASAFAGLSIVAGELGDELSTLRRNYGWTLTDGTQSAFFFAGGRRSYVDGAVINMNSDEVRPEPWTGFYWTSTASSAQTTAQCMYFNLDTSNASRSTLQTARQLQLSNGLQVRCVRE